ncbi:hypothetical protein OG897_28190 [Streptomyces sp. NBC_00237]|uniref:hypothetical protein n=1 Tax=Streptomyces sp. NBC_00237 TaxID=2975687 RepID=UPI00225845B5|nr:hypothetical protein [Streptomyces sp. NBC_00237]MCX5205325.1 hypothetical protein [Streptomyces sp. NBC_00237]
MSTGKLPQTRAVASGPDFASASVPRHLARGAIGLGLIVGSIALVPVVGMVALLAAPLALIAFRGCPTCWLVGLAQSVSRGRLERQCADGVCTLAKAPSAEARTATAPPATAPMAEATTTTTTAATSAR